MITVADTLILDPRTGEVLAQPGDALDDEQLYRMEYIGVEMNNQPPAEPMSNYRMYNPYGHLTQSSQLTEAEWQRIKARLSQADLADIENGGKVPVGKAARVWKQ